MKKKIFFILLLVWITITWCSDKSNFQFEFDNFYGYFFTEKTFVSDSKAEWLWYSILKNDILKIHKNQTSSWYTDNIIIVKTQSKDELDDFVKDTIQKTKIPWYKIETTSTMKINCLWEGLSWKSIKSKMVGNLDTTYFSHSFIKQDDAIYIISYSTPNEKERNTFSSDVKAIKCKK